MDQYKFLNAFVRLQQFKRTRNGKTQATVSSVSACAGWMVQEREGVSELDDQAQ
jgi:hypothetical protein